MSDNWMDELRGVDGALQPTGAARGEILEGVRRARRRRAVGLTAAAVASVTIIAVGAAVAPGALDDDASLGPVTTESPTATGSTEPDLFDCPEDSKVFSGEPVIDHLAEQQETVDEITSLVRNAWTVHHAEPTALGVVALVQGNVEFAERELSDYGVEHVFAWDPSGPEAGLDEEGQIAQAVNWIIDPAVRDVMHAARGIPGYASHAFWRNRGGVLLLWREPVPSEIQALAGVRPDGVEVFVEGVAYSSHEIQEAGSKVFDASRRGDISVRVTSSSACGDGSGLVVGIHPRDLGDRRVDLQQRLAQIAGMPVQVVPEEPVLLF